MKTKILVSVLFLSLTTLLFSQKAELLKLNAKNAKVTKLAPSAVEVSTSSSNVSVENVKTSPFGNSNITWVEATQMSNAFGPASRDLHPLQFDPYANILYIVNRGWSGTGNYAKSGGEIWYSYSTDYGATWKRVAAFNPGTAASGRYPSATFYNPSKSATLTDVGILSIYPQTVPAPSWSTFGWGIDLGQAGQSITGTVLPEDVCDWGSNIPCFTNDKNNEVYWFAGKAIASAPDTASVKIWKTSDFTTVKKMAPASWESVYFNNNGQMAIGQTSVKGVLYVGFVAPFNRYFLDTTDINGKKYTTILSGWNLGYAKSTDNGTVWIANNQGNKKLEYDSWSVCDIRRIPALAKFDRLWDSKKGDNFVSYQGGLNVDKDGFVHIIAGVTDTLPGTDGEQGVSAIVELFEKPDYSWDAKIIKEYSTNGQYNGYDTSAIFSYGYTPKDASPLDQTGLNCDIIMDTARQVMAAVWVGTGAGTKKFNDIFVSYRPLNGEWSAPVNITETPDVHETIVHAAPFLKNMGNDLYKLFLNYCYSDASLQRADGMGSSDFKNSMYVGSYVFNSTTAVESNGLTKMDFSLAQNYPNPFNPTTKISFSLPQTMKATLKIYDLLGKEVATLVDGVVNAGVNEFSFNASKLSSGVYFYTLSAGNFSSTKKMLLTK